MVALTVTFLIKEGREDEFITAMIDDAKGSVENELGCLRFNVFVSQDNPRRLFLWELYENEEALESHRRSPHYLQWRKIVEAWFDGPIEVHKCTPLYIPELDSL